MTFRTKGLLSIQLCLKTVWGINCEFDIYTITQVYTETTVFTMQK